MARSEPSRVEWDDAAEGAVSAGASPGDAIQTFLQLGRRSRLLDPAQLNEIKVHWLPELADAQALADRLVRRGWLTRFQTDQLQEGHDQALVLGPYYLLEVLGEGALGQVYKARHRDNRTVAALKVLRAELRNNREVAYQFWQERAVLASLAHPAFVRALEADPDGAYYYFAMEYVDGIDLARLLSLAGPLPVAQACDYVRQAALGLQYAHEQGLVHRDVKPQNLLVAFATDQVRILDIGSARREWCSAEGPNIGGRGALMGTADYIAPEQTLNPQGADTRADIYSLGCTFYHLLTGRPPFPGASLARKILDHQKTPPPSVTRARPEVPEKLAAVVQRMLAKRPEDRYATPAMVAVALASFCQGEAPRLDLERFRPQGAVTGETLSAADTQTVAPADKPRPPAERRPMPRPDSGVRPALGGPPNGIERRASPRRYGNLVPVLIRDAQGREEPIHGWVVDRSSGGLGLLLGEPLEIGTVMTVRPNRPDAADRWVEVRIVHCRKERIRWRVGCQFVHKLTWGVLSGFG